MTNDQFLKFQAIVTAMLEQDGVSDRAQEIYADLKANKKDYSGWPMHEAVASFVSGIFSPRGNESEG